nr:LuxR family transcriptional regulator [Rhodococcus sp. (in: high G+C Gram-positive bacteria)]
MAIDSGDGRGSASDLVGREDLAELLARMARRPGSGHRTLWLLGEAGIGKSTLLRYAAGVAVDSGARVLAASGVDAETHQVFSGLQQLLWPVMSFVDRLPLETRRSLDEALGRVPALGALDTFACRHAVLQLLEDLASDRPLVLLLDDAHLLDRDSLELITYVIRRVGGPVATLCSARGHRVPDGVDPGVPAIEVPSLTKAEAAVLIDRQPSMPSHSARLEIIHQAEGNPLAIVEFSRAVARSGTDMLAGAGVDRIRRVQSLFSVRLAALARGPRTLLLYAASGSGYETVDIITAAAGFGNDLSVWADAEKSGLISVDNRRVHFSHPLARAAAYSDCTVDERRRAHSDFADILVADPPCRAWHRAAASDGPDESVAAELEDAAELSQRRGGFFEVARALERAAQCSPDDVDAARRYARAAHAAYMAGDPQWGLALAAIVRSTTTVTEIRTAAVLPTSTILLQIGKPDESFQVIHRTLTDSMPEDESLALALLSTAVGAAYYAGGEEKRDRLAALAANLPQAGTDNDDFLSPMPDAAKSAVRQLIYEYSTGNAAPLQADVAALSTPARISYLLAKGARAYLTEKSADAASYYGQGIEALRDVGSLGAGATPLAAYAGVMIDTGRWDEFDSAATAAAEVATVGRMALVEALVDIDRARMATYRGDLASAGSYLGHASTLFDPRGNLALTLLHRRVHALTLCARGDFTGAYERLKTFFGEDGSLQHRILSPLALVDLAWAGSRSGQQRSARLLITAIGRHIGSNPPVRVGLLRQVASALVSETTRGAERHFTSASSAPASDEWPVERARAQLHYGEWLRRNRRPGDARRALSSALDTFDNLGATMFADIARAELRAAGGTRTGVSDGVAGGWASLTAQEQHIASLAAEGLTNREIGEQLHLSPRTIGSHLYHVYPKLGVSKRHELRRVIDTAVSR